jgi:hypothetical protein
MSSIVKSEPEASGEKCQTSFVVLDFGLEIKIRKVVAWNHHSPISASGDQAQTEKRACHRTVRVGQQKENPVESVPTGLQLRAQ